MSGSGGDCWRRVGKATARVGTRPAPWPGGASSGADSGDPRRMYRAGTGHVSAAAMRVGEGPVRWASAPSPQPCLPSALAPLAATTFRPEGLPPILTWHRCPGPASRRASAFSPDARDGVGPHDGLDSDRSRSNTGGDASREIRSGARSTRGAAGSSSAPLEHVWQHVSRPRRPGLQLGQVEAESLYPGHRAVPERQITPREDPAGPGQELGRRLADHFAALHSLFARSQILLACSPGPSARAPLASQWRHQG